jgi:hypothetical protein
MGFKITMMQSFRTRNLFDSFVLLGEGRDMVEVSQLMFDDLWMAMLGPWVHSCIHHSHYPSLSTTHWLGPTAFSPSKLWKVYCLSAGHQRGKLFSACGSGMFPASSDSDVGWFLHVFADVHLVLESIDRGHSFPVRNRNRSSLLKSRWLLLCQYIHYGWIWCLSEDGESGKIVILRYFNWKMMINNLVFR